MACCSIGRCVLPLEEEHVFEHAIGFGERLVDVAEVEGDALVHVAVVAVVVQARLGRGQRLLGVGDGGQRLVARRR